MDTPPVPKPRSAIPPQKGPSTPPVPLPRTKIPTSSEKVTASDTFKSISTASKQISEDVAQKVSNSAKTANERFEKLKGATKFAKDTLDKTLSTSRAVRNSATMSVIEGTKTGLKLSESKKSDSIKDTIQRSVSMPLVDVSLFDNIQFNSPMLEQKRFHEETDRNVKSNEHMNLQSPKYFDALSTFSCNSDNTDSISCLSYDTNRELEPNISNTTSDNEQQLTYYDITKQSRTNSIISSASSASLSSCTELPEHTMKSVSDNVVMEHSSKYVNWTLPFQTAENKSNVSTSNECMSASATTSGNISNSAIYEFDPLHSSTLLKRYEGVSNELLLLESFLIGDIYGTIVATETNDGLDESFDFYECDYFNPPIPPERSESLLPEEKSNDGNEDKNCQWYDAIDMPTKPIAEEENKTTISVMQRFSHILKFEKHTPSKAMPAAVEKINKPQVNSLLVPPFNGILTRIVSGVVEDLFKNSQTRHCVLSDQKLLCYMDPTNSILKEAYTLDNIYSIQIVLPLYSTTNNSYCFELAVSPGNLKHAPRKILFSCASAPERRNWAQKIAEHLTYGFASKYTAEFTRCGWCYIKKGFIGEWRGAWIMIIRRVMIYYTSDDPTVETLDLRKTRCIVTQQADEITKSACPNDGSDNLLLDFPESVFYFRFPHERELKGWQYMIKLAAHNNGTYIHHQQLTKEDVPTIVDKCLSFIYVHGSLSEGIYRRAGSNVVLSELLAKFRRDAWSVHLSHVQHTEHEVAGVLKRFFRDLAEPLVPLDKHNELINIAGNQDLKVRYTEYGRVMRSLPLIARNTSRKLFAHLHFIHTLAHINKMNAENLSSIWAPTIMPTAVATPTVQTAWSSTEVLVVRDLIANFEAIWEPTEAEKNQEKVIRSVIMRILHNTAPAPPKAAGDLKTWVYVHDRNVCYQVSLTPNKKCSDICIELSERAKMESHELMLEEVICNNSMRRIVHIDEIVLDVALRWSYWDEDDRKHNYLIVRNNKLLHDIEQFKQTSNVSGELKLATESMKSFKLHMFEVQNSKLCYFKDKQASHKIEEWDIKDILWYIGHEPKRNPQTKWSITFIPKNKQKRSKDKPWFGCTIAGAVAEDQLKWMAAIMFAEHSIILPTPLLVIT